MTNDSSVVQDMNTKQYLGVNRSQGLALTKRENVTMYFVITVPQQSILWSIRRTEFFGASAAKKTMQNRDFLSQKGRETS